MFVDSHKEHFEQDVETDWFATCATCARSKDGYDIPFVLLKDHTTGRLFDGPSDHDVYFYPSEAALYSHLASKNDERKRKLQKALSIQSPEWRYL